MCWRSAGLSVCVCVRRWKGLVADLKRVEAVTEGREGWREAAALWDGHRLSEIDVVFVF